MKNKNKHMSEGKRIFITICLIIAGVFVLQVCAKIAVLIFMHWDEIHQYEWKNHEYAENYAGPVYIYTDDGNVVRIKNRYCTNYYKVESDLIVNPAYNNAVDTVRYDLVISKTVKYVAGDIYFSCQKQFIEDVNNTLKRCYSDSCVIPEISLIKMPEKTKKNKYY